MLDWGQLGERKQTEIAWDKKEKAGEISSWKVCRRRFSLIAKHPLCGVSSVQCGGCVVWMHTIWVTQNSMKTQLVGWKCKISCNIAKVANCRDGWPSIGETLELWVTWETQETAQLKAILQFANCKFENLKWPTQLANPVGVGVFAENYPSVLNRG